MYSGLFPAQFGRKIPLKSNGVLEVCGLEVEQWIATVATLEETNSAFTFEFLYIPPARAECEACTLLYGGCSELHWHGTTAYLYYCTPTNGALS